MSVHPYEHTDGFWLGCLSIALAHAVKGYAMTTAEETLRDFLRSPVPSPELKRIVREELKTK